MVDAFISWINPQAAVRELLIGLVIAIVGGFAFIKAQKFWESLTGFASNQSKKSSERVQRMVKVNLTHKTAIPLLTSQISSVEFILTNLLIFIFGFAGLDYIAQRSDAPSNFTFPNPHLTHVILVTAAIITTILFFVMFFMLYQLYSARRILTVSANEATPREETLQIANSEKIDSDLV